MEIKTTIEIRDIYSQTNLNETKEDKIIINKKWVAGDDHLKIMNKIGILCVGKPSRYDSEQIEKIRKLCLKQIDTLSNENKKEDD